MTRSLFAIVMIATVGALGCSGSESSVSTDTSNQTAAKSDAKKGSRFTQMKNGPTDKDLAALSAAGTKFDSAFLGTYRFNKVTSEHTDPVAREKRVKEVMHRFMCSFFDDSIDIGRNTGANAVKTTLNDVDMENNASGEDADIAKFTSALTQVFKDKNLDVLSGGASGNNTIGEVMGVYDTAHDEILYFGFTNCGSDD